MAEGSRDQGSVSAADSEEDSPNMIVYRKVRPTLRSTTEKILLETSSPVFFLLLRGAPTRPLWCF